jgi:hypothetical protein
MAPRTKDVIGFAPLNACENQGRRKTEKSPAGQGFSKWAAGYLTG